MPTGISLRDPREQLFEAAERVLLDAGPSALTSRAVTAEAGCAKGVLHRYFTDFDGFLAELVLSRAGRLDAEAAVLRATAGTGTVIGNVRGALDGLFSSVAVAVVALVIFRDELRARLRETWPTGVPLLTEAAAMLAEYLAAERELGRLTASADVRALGAALVGAGHLHYADRTAGPPDAADIEHAIRGVLGTTLTTP